MVRNGEMKASCYADYLERCQSAISGCADLDLRDSDRKTLSQFLISGLESCTEDHQHYRYYSSAERIRKIKDTGAIYLTDGARWNDKYDRERFNSRDCCERHFALCMSRSTVESVAMWMLYADHGKGAMIDFSAFGLKRALSRDRFNLGYFDKDGKFVCECAVDAGSVDFGLSDMLYFRRDKDGGTQLKRKASNERWVAIGEEIRSCLSSNIKHDAWAFEREVRLIASVKREKLKHGTNPTCLQLQLDIGDKRTIKGAYSSPLGRLDDFMPSELDGSVDWSF